MNLGKDRNQYAGEGTSRQNYIRLDKNNKFIDLNQPFDDENMNEYNDEKLDQVKNVGEGSNRNYTRVDRGGQFIDLNQPYDDENMNKHNEEDLSQVKNADEGSSYNLDLKL